MTFAGFITLLTAFVQFPQEVLALVKMLQKTPQEKHQDLIAKLQAESDAFSKPGGRPI